MTTLKLRATEKGYYNDEIIREGQVFSWTKPAWAETEKKKNGEEYTLAELIPPWAEPTTELPKETPKKTTDDLQRDAAIINAVQSLDHSNDEHWTSKGEPAMDAVEEAAGFDVTRAEVKAMCPGYGREE